MNFYTLDYKDDNLMLLDQTRLPGETIYLQLTDYVEVIEAIKCLSVRGAPAIGVAAAYASVLAANQAGNRQELLKMLGEIKDARPTAVNLAWAIRQAEALADTNPELSPAELKPKLLELAREIHEDDVRMCARIGQNGAELIKDGMTIVTHCNAGALATAGIGTALAVIYTAHKQGKRIKVYADETRPLLQGARLTTWELAQEGVDVTLNTDSMAAYLMQQGDIDCVITGADRVAKNYDVANKIGTYGLAVSASYHNVPFYVAIPVSTYDSDCPSGKEIEIEMRDSKEITEWGGIRTAPEGVKTYSPAFDVTPHKLVSAIITDQGIIRPNP